MERNRAFIIWLRENVNIKGNCYRGWKQCQSRMLSSALGWLVHQSTNPYIGISWSMVRAGSHWSEVCLHREQCHRVRIEKFSSRQSFKDSTCPSLYLYPSFSLPSSSSSSSCGSLPSRSNIHYGSCFRSSGKEYNLVI